MLFYADAHISFGTVSWGQISTRQPSFAPLSPLSPPLTPPQTPTPNEAPPQQFPARNSPAYKTLAEHNRIRKSKGLKRHVLQLNGPRKPNQPNQQQMRPAPAPGRSTIKKSKKVHLPHFFTPVLGYLPKYRVTKAPLAPKWDPASGLSRHEFFHIHRFFT